MKDDKAKFVIPKIDLPAGPTAASIPALAGISMLIIGRTKTGKSTLANSFPSVLHADVEGTMSHIAGHKVRIGSWPEFVGLCRTLREQNGEKRFRVLNIDTIDELFRQCRSFVLEQWGIIHEADEEYGKGWDLVRGEFQRILTPLFGLGMGLIFSGHCQEKAVKTRVDTIDRIVCALPDFIRRWLESRCDLVAMLEVEGRDNSRFLYCQPTETFTGGDRWGRMPLKVGPLSENAYQIINVMWKRGRIAASAKREPKRGE